jgi:hypothetical protein
MAWSKRSLDCARCPKDGRGDRSDGCPLWWRTRWQNGAEEKEIVDCGLVQLPTYLAEVIKASNRPAAAIESTRNEISAGFAQVVRQMMRVLPFRVDNSQESLNAPSECSQS